MRILRGSACATPATAIRQAITAVVIPNRTAEPPMPPLYSLKAIPPSRVAAHTMICADDSLVFHTIGDIARTGAQVEGRKRMKVFVTGVSGYAGFYGALRLAAAGHMVTGLVRHPEQPRLNTLRIQEVRLLPGDVG